MKRKRHLFRLITLAGALLIALGVGEVGVRLLGVDQRKNDLGVEPHALWHHWHRPGYAFDYHVVAEGYDVPVRFNRLGMRDSREITIAKQPGVFRVAVLGDSFVEAMQVREEEGVCRQLENQLRARLSRPAEVLNFGCSGFSSTLELVLLREHVRQFSPDLVICLHHFSDVSEDWSYSSRAHLEDGRVAAVPLSLAPGERTMRDVFEASQLYRVTRGKLSATRRRSAAGRNRSLQETFDAIVHEPYTPEDEVAWQYSLRAVEEMAELARKEQVPFLLVIIPIGTQVEPVDADFTRELGFEYLAGGKRLESRAYQDKLKQFCEEKNITCVDLLQDFRAANPDGKPRFYLPRDQHWTATGHALAATSIARRLK
jgi:hypothetical protein